MADQEEVVYSYVGDVSSLHDATQEAIQLLSSYQKKIKDLQSANVFKNDKVTKEFSQMFGQTIKDANKLASEVNKVARSVNNLPSKSDKTAVLPDSTDLSETVKYLKEASTVLDKIVERSKAGATRVKQMTESLMMADFKMSSYSTGMAVSENYSKWLDPKELKSRDDLVSGRSEQYAASGKTFAEIPTISGGAEDVIRDMEKAKQAVANTTQQMEASIQNATDSVKQDMQSMSDSTSEAAQTMSSSTSEVSEAFRRVNTAGDDASDSLKSVKKQHESLRGIVQKLKRGFHEEASAVTEEDEAVEDENESLSKAAKLRKNLIRTTAILSSSLTRAGSKLTEFSKHFRSLHKGVLPVKRLLSMLIGVPLARWLAKSVRESIRYTETLNLFEVATRGATEEAKDFVDQMQEVYGMDPSSVMRYIGNFRQLTDAIEMPERAATKLSLGLTKATNDISSLFNVPIEQVFQDMSSGMQGMSRAVRKYGMDIRATTLQETAATLGITEQVSRMSEADRQGLRYITMMRQAANANGDFARTIETPANQLRIFKEQMVQLGRAIGDLFIGPLSRAIQYINGFVMALRMVITFVGTLLGVTKHIGGSLNSVGDAADSMSNIGSAAEDSAEQVKELRKTLAPFDELNILQDPNKSSDAQDMGSFDGVMNPAISQAIEDMDVGLENVRMKANEVRDAILDFFGFKVDGSEIISWDSSEFEKNLIDKFPQWTQSIQALFDNWKDIVQGFKNVFWSLVDVAKNVKDKVLEALHINDTTVATFIGNLADNLNRLSDWISEHSDQLATLVIAFGAFKLLAPIIPIVVVFVGWILKAVGGIVHLGEAFLLLPTQAQAVIGIAALLAGTFIDLWHSSDRFREEVVDACKHIASVVKTTWEKLLKPILSRAMETVKKLYTNTIKPIVEKISVIILTLWNDILAPVLEWLIRNFGPAVAGVVKTIFDVVDWLFEHVGNVIEGILTALQGVIDFVAGVFTGDWERAWHGILNILIGVLNAVISVVTGILNVIISAINAVISVVWNGMVGFINSILDLANALGDVLGQHWELHITSEPWQIGYLDYQIPEIPMATGGVVTGPTHALIGEGNYDEAVVPLGNSPQMNEFADNVASRINNEEQVELLKEQNSLLRRILDKTGRVNIDGRELTSMVSDYQEDRERALGV